MHTYMHMHMHMHMYMYVHIRVHIRALVEPVEPRCAVMLRQVPCTTLEDQVTQQASGEGSVVGAFCCIGGIHSKHLLEPH